MSKLVSIIIPVYNRQELVKETLDSVLAQTYENWECIVVDDGSTDDTWKVLEEYANKDSRIKVHKRNREPKGAPTCRNIGMELSEGEYIIFLDSDDLLAKWALQHRISNFSNCKNADVIISNGIQFNEKTYLNDTSIYNTNSILEDFLKFNVVFQTTCPTWRKAFLIKNKIKWDEEAIVWQDVDFHINCFNFEPIFFWGEKKPDNYLRRENDEDRVTSNKNIIIKVANNFKTYEKWLENKENRKILQKYFPKYMMDKLEFLLTQKELRKFLKDHGGLIRNEIGLRAFFYLKIYCLFKNIKIVNGLIYRSRFTLTGVSRKL